MSELVEMCRQLRAARLDAGLTVDEVAERVGVTQPTISHWEWRRGIRCEHLFAWARALGYDVVLVPAAGNDCKSLQPVHADATTATRDGGP